MRFHREAWTLRVAAGIVAVACLTAGAASAQVPIPGYPNRAEAFDPREVAMLPRYCLYTQMFREFVPGANDPTQIARWYEVMGPTYHHVHHYCLGLMKMNRGMYLARGDQNARRFYLGDAVIEMEYVISKADDSFVLMPEMLTKKGQNLAALGKGPAAVMHYERAIQVKEDYWPAYAQLSDYYKESGDTKRAREVLESGLTRVPDAKALQRRLSELEPAVGRGSNKR